jgi:hypothetical protein
MVVGVTLLALALVHLRAEQVRCAGRIAAAEADWVRLRRDLWAVQTRAARLRTPQRLHERVESLQAELVHPTDEVARRSRTRLAAGAP